METTHKLDELFQKVHKQKITEDDLSYMKTALNLPCTEGFVIKRFSKEDSVKLYQTIVNSLISKVMLVVSRSEIDSSVHVKDIVSNLYEFMFKESVFQSSLCYLEHVRIKGETNKRILEILKFIKVEAVEDKMKYFLANKDDRDSFGANFALMVDKVDKIKNKECKILNAKKLDVQFLEVIVNTKKHLTKENLKYVFNLSKEKLFKSISTQYNNQQEISILLAIISEVNTLAREKDLSLMRFIPECINEIYLGFLYSLMVDKESIECAWNILNENNLIYEILQKLKVVQEILHEENLNLYNSDIFFIKYGISIINLVLDTIKECKPFFITHSDSFINLLWTKLPNDVLAILFGFTSLLIYDEEIQVKVYEYFQHVEIFNSAKKDDLKKKGGLGMYLFNSKTLYDVFKEESKTDVFTLTVPAVFLCSKILNYGMFETEIFEYFNTAIKSSNPEVLLCILQKMIDKKHPITEHVISNIKMGMEKNGDLCDTFLKFCIANCQHGYIDNIFRFISSNINFMYLIFSSRSEDFFKFIKQMDSREVVIFIGDDFLDRITDNPEDGLEYLISVCKGNVDFSNFVMKRANFFNNLNNGVLKLKLYDILSENNIDDFEILLDGKNKTDGFVLPEIQTNEYFNIISRIIQREYQEDGCYKDYVVKKYEHTDENIPGYCKYIKMLITVDINVEKDVKNLVSLGVESENIAELVGFYRTTKNSDIKYNYTPKKILNMILNKIGSFDNEFFTKKFEQASQYEKFLLFFILDPSKIDNEVIKLIVKEINALVSNDPFSCENDPLLSQCLDFMVYSKKVGQVIRVFNGIDIPDKFIDPLIRINFVGLVNKEREMFSIKHLKRASIDLQVKICVLAFFNKTLNMDVIRELVFNLRKSVVDENLEFLFKEMQRVDG